MQNEKPTLTFILVLQFIVMIVMLGPSFLGWTWFAVIAILGIIALSLHFRSGKASPTGIIMALGFFFGICIMTFAPPTPDRPRSQP